MVVVATVDGVVIDIMVKKDEVTGAVKQMVGVDETGGVVEAI